MKRKRTGKGGPDHGTVHHGGSRFPPQLVGALPCPNPGKYAYNSKRQAKTVLRAHRGRDRAGLQVYGCVCRYFHIGHKAGTKPGSDQNVEGDVNVAVVDEN